MTAINLQEITRQIDADARQEAGRTGASLTSLRRYGLTSHLSGHTLRELKDALTLPEMVAERGRLDRPLTKDDYVKLLTSKALYSLTEN